MIEEIGLRYIAPKEPRNWTRILLLSTGVIIVFTFGILAGKFLSAGRYVWPSDCEDNLRTRIEAAHADCTASRGDNDQPVKFFCRRCVDLDQSQWCEEYISIGNPHAADVPIQNQ